MRDSKLKRWSRRVVLGWRNSELRHRLKLSSNWLRSVTKTRNPVQMPRVIHADWGLLVTWLPGSTRRLVLVFTCAVPPPLHGRPMEFAALAQADSSHVLFVTDRRHCWYSRRGLKEQIVQIVSGFCKANDIADLRALGISMGAYGAILLSSLLPIRQIVAFSPQILMSEQILAMPQWVNDRPRLRKDLVPDLAPTMLVSLAHFNVIYGDQDVDDLIHSTHLPKAPHIDTLILPGCGHNVAKWLKEKGVLFDLGCAMLNGRTDLVDQFRQSLIPSDAVAIA